MHVDNLLSIETDNLAREVLITLKREGLPPNDQWREFLEQYALTGWYAASDAIAWATLAKIANSEWDKTVAYADEDHVETVAQDLGDNAIEGVVVIDAKTGDTLFDRTGVVRADGSQYVGMQDTEADALLAEALSGRDLIFVHNHTEEIGASDEDLESAFRAGAKLLIVITQQGQDYVYIRGRYGMVEVRDDKASYKVGPVNPDETEELHDKSEEQAAAFLVDSPELIFLQGEHYVNLRVNGSLQLYENVEGMLHGDAASFVLPDIPDGFRILVLDQDPSHPYAVKINAAGNEYWIDLRDDTSELEFERIGEAPQQYKQHRAQVSGQEYDNTSLDFMSALTEALEPQPIGIVTVSGNLRLFTNEGLTPHVNAGVPELSVGDQSIEFNVYEQSEQNPHAVLIDLFGQKFLVDSSDSKVEFTVSGLGKPGGTSEREAEGVVATETESEYHRQSLAPGEDTEEENVEISHRVYADRTRYQLGWLTRDYNTTTNTKFDVQSSVIGPDVRVELVIQAESDPESRLGNYVVISFPASVYLSDPKTMQRLKMQNLASQRLWDRSLTEEDLTKRAQMQRMARLTAHNPELWHEDDRIFMAYAHLSRIEPHIVAGLHIDDADKSLIGKTGNTGKGIQYHHLDLLEVIVGSSDPGSGALERMLERLRQKYVVEGSQDVQHFFDLVIESQLYPHGGSSLYSENLDTARTQPELDTFRLAQYLSAERDPNDTIYFEDE